MNELRYEIVDQSIFFKKIPMVMHISFSRNYQGLTIASVRRKLKKSFTKAQQNELIHYLKTQNYIKQ
jgi:hypothetical protein